VDGVLCNIPVDVDDGWVAGVVTAHVPGVLVLGFVAPAWPFPPPLLVLVDGGRCTFCKAGDADGVDLGWL
jgi:hypothetical protein